MAEKMFLYLARRDKSDVKLLAILPGHKYPATRVLNPDDLEISPSILKEVKKEVASNKMLWELWIQGAANFQEIRESLNSRGYKNIPYFSNAKYYERTPVGGHKQPSLRNLPTVKTMQRRQSLKLSLRNAEQSKKNRLRPR